MRIPAVTRMDRVDHFPGRQVVDVARRRREVLMAQLAADHVEGNVVARELACVRVPEAVRVHALVDARLAREVFQAFAHRRRTATDEILSTELAMPIRDVICGLAMLKKDGLVAYDELGGTFGRHWYVTPRGLTWIRIDSQLTLTHA